MTAHPRTRGNGDSALADSVDSARANGLAFCYRPRSSHSPQERQAAGICLQATWRHRR